MRTQVGIIGAGPAGLLLSHMLAHAGIDSIIIDSRSQEYVQSRLRAGVLEQRTVEILTEAGVATRLHAEGLRHDGIYLQWPGERVRIDLLDTCGRSTWIYGQTELTKDLFELRAAAGLPTYFEVRGTRVVDALSQTPSIHFTDSAGQPQVIECDAIAGCDGYQGVSRESIPERERTAWLRAYPFSWLGLLVDVPPSTDELIYAWHPEGFAFHSMRSLSLSRLYIQISPDDHLEAWPDDKVWAALDRRLGIDGWTLQRGATLEKAITPMRSFVGAPMRYGNLFLAGDSAHVVPPTGGKGLNLAIGDVALLARALERRFNEGSTDLVDAYSDTALQRVWRATHFSWWMTSMLHTPGPQEPSAAFTRELQVAQLRYTATSLAAATSLAENYTGYEG